ncbi:MAG: ABC transporter ATP-binding protein [Defluviitaleaceae bacterium]|nr:ABC transporter ATP-binding protein [Defluviitaleaceae bacterium]
MIASMTNIVKRYGSNTALDHMNMTIVKGEVLGLLGPNGAGKSTAIRVLTGLTGTDAGEAQLFGKKVKGHALDLKKRIGVVPQDLALYETLPAQDNLAYFGKLYGVTGVALKERVGEVLEILGLAEVAKKAPKKFSGGMKRRLNIGCAVMHKPELLILDEPTVGIDPQSRNHILDFIEEMARQGTTVLYTSHYMEEVARLCSRILIMDGGRVIAEGSVEEITRSVLFEETLALEVKDPSAVLLENIKHIQGVVSCEAAGQKITVVSTAGAANMHRILEVAMPNIILGVTAQRPTLEDAFLALTGKTLRDGGDA